MTSKPLTKKELAWARREAKKLGIKDPEEFLNMRWSEVVKLAGERGLDWVIYPMAKKKPAKQKKARKPR